MKWMRHQTVRPRPDNVYHLPMEPEYANPEMRVHYLRCKCRRELKDLNWDIADDPPASQCCPDCLKTLKSK